MFKAKIAPKVHRPQMLTGRLFFSGRNYHEFRFPFEPSARVDAGSSFCHNGIVLLFGKNWLADLSNPLWFTLMLVWLFAVIMGAAFAIVHHAESLAVRLGEPLGTLVLTLAVIGIEVMMISAVMLTGESKPALARDAMFGVVMIVLNGMIGVSLLLGGLRHHEQEYNLRGANSFCL